VNTAAEYRLPERTPGAEVELSYKSTKETFVRKLLTVLLVSALVGALGAPGAEAKKPKKKSRSIEMPYTEPAVGAAGVGVCFQGSSCVFTEPLPGERKVSIEITDDLGLPVHASVIQDTSGDGNYLAADDETVHICGSTEKPLKIKSQTVTVWVWRGPGALPPCPGLASAGKVKLTFSR
jgi:hypothetical protein